MLTATIQHHYHMTIEIKFVAISTNVKMVVHNVVTMQYALTLKDRIIAVVETDLPEGHHRHIVNQWKEFVQTEQFVIEMPRYAHVHIAFFIVQRTKSIKIYT